MQEAPHDCFGKLAFYPIMYHMKLHEMRQQIVGHAARSVAHGGARPADDIG
jgi:hypothetical protein